ncbi:uncharacterized protein LOC119792268 [Cyprinodon tularosa]|uniref:uncharacterized protein LOC119783202 n=1 Tax=Cyprinodon tularosa TaxID=77115 RepID=UPI0018E21787|nr:uncharacterized protein LOC119783202 [Cyprinodon tularosa]XP_038154767.1 uncharacterized protein LOC119792268 [Cyprinodon tularosa]
MSLPSVKGLSTEDVCSDVKPKGQELVSGPRTRKLTGKGEQYREAESAKWIKAFLKSYGSWKQIAREARRKLKGFCSQENLNEINQQVQNSLDKVKQNYECLQRNSLNTPDIVQKLDACTILTNEIYDLVCKRLEGSIVEENFNQEVEKERVREILNRDEYQSVFGEASTENSSCAYGSSTTSSKVSQERVIAEADLAAKRVQVKSMLEIEAQHAKVSKLECEWKCHESQIMAEMKQKEAEVLQQLDEEKSKLKVMETDMEVKMAAARVDVYSRLEDGVERENLDFEPEVKSMQPLKHPRKSTARAATILPSQVCSEISAVNLAEALTSSLSLSRLPVPIPAIFSGDPLKFVDFKISFTTLIDSKAISAGEKMLYLKSYLSGEARKAVEGFFYRSSEDAYEGAWAVLQERYGNSFVIQKAFRDKLKSWPKIAPNDPSSLRDFADFLKSCEEAMPQVKGLSILNDCEENHKMLKKLPDWVVRKWSRVVVEVLDACGEYPSFECFSRFIKKEARIACNPIASPFLLKSRTSSNDLSRKAKALSTSTEFKKQETVHVLKSKLPCLVCTDTSHSIAKCPKFAVKSMEDKMSFIHQNHLCFGCLRKGHLSKDCKTRHVCGECRRHHPTCLHLERVRSQDAAQQCSISSEETPQVSRSVLSHALTRNISATSSIVPVFLSSVKDPGKEILTYALLDTQNSELFL